jgi:hypothetical protein
MKIETLATVDSQNPWPGLAPFGEDSALFFNGRQVESIELRRLVMHAPLTALFASSGLGKTSLIQAGLFPLLRRENILPVYIRLDVRDRSAPLIEQVRLALEVELRKQQVDGPEFQPGETLWEYLHQPNLEFWSSTNHLLTPVFVFDQFEEIFTLGADNRSAVAELRVDLADLVENRLPAKVRERIETKDMRDTAISLDAQGYRILLSFREEFLPALENWKREIPSILRNRYRLVQMTGEQAFEAIHGSAPFIASEDVSRKIIAFVAPRSAAVCHPGQMDESNIRSQSSLTSMSDLAVDPAILSLVCHELNEKRKVRRKSAFDDELLSEAGDEIISGYYRQSLRGLPERVERMVETELITERGFRKQYDVDDARSKYGVTAAEIQLLVDRRLLRIVPQRGSEQVELSHDRLTEPVREQRDRRREIEKALIVRRRLILLGAISVALAAMCFGFWWLYHDAEKQRMLADSEHMRAEKLVEALQRLQRSNPSSKGLGYVLGAGDLQDTSSAPPPAPVQYEGPPPGSRGVLPSPTSTNGPTPRKNPSYTVTQLSRLYDFPAEFTGEGQCIGLINLGGGYTQADLKTYFTKFGLETPNVVSVSVDGAQNHPGDSAGATVSLQIEVVGSLAPAARIVVYFAPNTSAGFINAVHRAATDAVNKPSVISIGWGSPEQTWTKEALASLNGELEGAAKRGITVIAATGDQGASDGLSGLQAVDFPASSPWVTAVGGTRLNAASYRIVSEEAWNDPPVGSTGRGVSANFPKPSWQKAVKPPASPAGFAGRAIPDVAAAASPLAGYRIFYDGHWMVLGGTDAAAPLWAGLIAELNEGLGRNLGYLNPLLYSKLGPSGIFRNVGGAGARPGWNASTGWGSPDGRKLLNALRNSGAKGI